MIAFIAILTIIYLIHPSSGPRLKGYQQKSLNNISTIGSSLQMYRQNNQGAIPMKLSDLLPYIPDNRVFFISNNSANIYYPTSANINEMDIDVFSPYRFIQINDKRCLVFENIGMWRDKSIGFCIISSNLTVVRPERRERILVVDFYKMMHE